MRQYVLLFGGSGERVAQALIFALCAGIFPAETVEALLVDTDQAGDPAQALRQGVAADYAHAQMLAETTRGGCFGTELHLRSWPEALPGDDTPLSVPGDSFTLRRWTEHAPVDDLLCRALFDEQTAELDLRQGFHGQRNVGQMVFSALLSSAMQHPEDALNQLLRQIREDCDAGQEPRVVLAGSLCGGTGSAGIPAMARLLRQRLPSAVHISAVALLPATDGENARNAQAALHELAEEDLCGAVCVLGIPRCARAEQAPSGSALTDWLAVYCMDMLLHRPTALRGVFTVRSAEGPVDWSLFGKAEGRYRLAYGRLFKAALAWRDVVGPEVTRRLAHPFFLRDALFGWYARFFRRVKENRTALAEDAACIRRLMGLCLAWLNGMSRAMPAELRYATALADIRQDARQHYQELVQQAGKVALMEEDARQARESGHDPVYRGGEERESEEEANIRLLADARATLAQMVEAQNRLNHRMGGMAAMDMLAEALRAAQKEEDALRAQYREAFRRIEHAAQTAPKSEQHRVETARTRLRRMERHLTLLSGRTARVQEDLRAARETELRLERPALIALEPESDMLDLPVLRRLGRAAAFTPAEVDEFWSQAVPPGQAAPLRQTLRTLRPAKGQGGVMALYQALFDHAMKEER